MHALPSRQPGCLLPIFPPAYHVFSKKVLFDPVLKNTTDVLTSRTCLCQMRFSYLLDSWGGLKLKVQGKMKVRLEMSYFQLPEASSSRASMDLPFLGALEGGFYARIICLWHPSTSNYFELFFFCVLLSCIDSIIHTLNPISRSAHFHNGFGCLFYPTSPLSFLCVVLDGREDCCRFLECMPLAPAPYLLCSNTAPNKV